MKKIYSIIVSIAIFSVANSQIISIPDANFKAKLISNGVDTNNDGEIEESEALNVNTLNIGNSNISSLSGIEYFFNLTQLNCLNNNLTNLPVQNLLNLTYINCDENQLTTLSEVENLPLLSNLYFSGNQISSINLENLHNLHIIWCLNNLLSEINLCGTNVTMLWCSGNPNLHSLYLKNNVVSFSSKNALTPPPLYAFKFFGCPINYFCYDDGEYDAILNGLSIQITGITFETTCICSSLLSNEEIDLTTIDIFIFPNPTNNNLNIELNGNDLLKNTNIYNTLGQLIKSISQNEKSIDVKDLNPGTYFITIETDKGKSTQKFIKI